MTSTGFNEQRSQSYDDRIRRHIPGYEILHDVSETMLAAELPEHAALLIAGIGTGGEALSWSPKHPGWTFAGVDPSEAMIRIAREKVAAAGLAKQIALTVGEVKDLPETAYDAATLQLVLHFLPDNGGKEELLTAIAERLKPGAPFLMSTIFGDPQTTRFKRLRSLAKSWALAHGIDAKQADELYDPERKDLFAVPEDRIKALFRYAGFIDVQRIYQAINIGLWFARTPRYVMAAESLEKTLKDEGYSLHTWSNSGGFWYPPHDHPYRKVIVVKEGSITFYLPAEGEARQGRHAEKREVPMKQGDRLDLPPRTEHSATVGPDGVTCLEGQK